MINIIIRKNVWLAYILPEIWRRKVKLKIIAYLQISILDKIFSRLNKHEANFFYFFLQYFLFLSVEIRRRSWIIRFRAKYSQSDDRITIIGWAYVITYFHNKDNRKYLRNKNVITIYWKKNDVYGIQRTASINKNSVNCPKKKFKSLVLMFIKNVHHIFKLNQLQLDLNCKVSSECTCKVKIDWFKSCQS